MNSISPRLANRIAWVTGGSSGIGQHSALRLARAGARVIVSGRNSGQIQQTIESHPDLDMHGIAVDVSDREAVSEAAREISERFGTIDILVNSAGLNVPNRSWSAVDPASFDHVVSVNLNGTVYCTLAVLPGMRTKKDGVVINIASWAGRFVSSLTGPAYTAAKHAVGALTMSLNMEECFNGIRACAIFPGEAATPILKTRAVPPSAEEEARMLQPQQIAEAVGFVAEMAPNACVNEIVISPTWNRSFPSVQARLANGGNKT